MRRPVVTLAVLLLVLTGCTPGDEVVVPDPEPTVEPMFASDEEALAAAEEALKSYASVSDQILNEGGADPERLLKVATEAVLEQELSAFATFASRNWRSVGYSTVDSLQLQSLSLDEMRVYACFDASAVDVVDVEGVSQVSPDRIDRTPFEFAIIVQDGHLLVAEKTLWTGGDLC